MATAAQIRDYNIHKAICQQIGATQATLKHGQLQGAISAPSATGVTRYTGPGPKTTAPTTVDTLVWASWQPLSVRAQGNDPETGREGEQRIVGQFPAIDDNQNVITVSHDDTLTRDGISYRILSPVLQPDGGFYSFQLTKRR